MGRENRLFTVFSRFTESLPRAVWKCGYVGRKSVEDKESERVVRGRLDMLRVFDMRGLRLDKGG